MMNLTREEILAMKPGRKLDALVAEKVFGWGNTKRCTGGGWSGNPPEYMNGCRFGDYRDRKEVPNYSTAIAAAWEVLMKFPRYFIAQGYGELVCKVFMNKEPEPSGIAGSITAPEAIVKAALMAVLHL